MTDIPIGLLDTAIAITAGALFTLVGIIYKRLKDRIRELESNLTELETAILEAKSDLDTAHTWMFGKEVDPTNAGISKEIQRIQKRLQKIIDTLHDDDGTEFDREDVEIED